MYFTYIKAHVFTDTRILNIYRTKSHRCCSCVCGRRGDFKIFPGSVSVNSLFQIKQVSNASRNSLISVWLNVAIPKVRCDNLSGEEMYSIHWICPVHVRRS
jgi:hypothetical protein